MVAKEKVERADKLDKLLDPKTISTSLPPELHSVLNNDDGASDRFSNFAVEQSPVFEDLNFDGNYAQTAAAIAVAKNPAVPYSQKAQYVQLSQAMQRISSRPTMTYIDNAPTQIPPSVLDVPNEEYRTNAGYITGVLKKLLGDEGENNLYERVRTQALRGGIPKVAMWLSQELFCAAKSNSSFDIEIDAEAYSEEMDADTTSIINTAVTNLFGPDNRNELFRLARYKKVSLRQIILILTERILERYKQMNEYTVSLFGQVV